MNKRINLQLFAFPFPKEFKFPVELEEHKLMEMHSAWYAGDPNKLHTTYSSLVGKVGGSTKQSFWTKKIEDGIVKLHVPIASDIATTSADILFSEMPEITIPEAEQELQEAREKAKAEQEAQKAPKPPAPPSEGEEDITEEPVEAPAPEEPTAPIKIEPQGEGTKAQARLDEIIEESGFANRLLEAGEVCASIGGVYLVPTWDVKVANHPILSVCQADNAIPEFRWGYLVALTFWREVYRNDDTGIVYRHLERREAGTIENGLFKGTDRELGVQVPLTERPETANMVDVIQTGWERIMAEYVPNMRPNRRFRGSAYGQSDLAGVEPLLDALDEVYSSWMRDVRLARARILVPESFLDFEESQAEGSNATPYFDIDKAVYMKLAMDPLTAKESPMTLHQFDIRAEKHMQTAYELLERIVTHAGYSPQTFGLKLEGKAESGTALNQRERKTYVTRLKKWKYWKHAVENILEMMLHIDNFHLKNGTPVLRPTAELSDSMNTDLISISGALQALNNAQAVSIDTKVRMLHPDWDEERIEAEVEAIKEEQGIGAEPPIESPIGGDLDEEDDELLEAGLA